MWPPRSGNKYHAKTVEYGGNTYRSRLEASFAAELDCRLEADDIRAWDRQIRVKLEANGVRICVYVVDFRVLHTDGSIEWIETKGCWTDVAKLKVKMFKALYLHDKPNERYTLITKNDIWTPRKTSPTTHRT